MILGGGRGVASPRFAAGRNLRTPQGAAPAERRDARGERPGRWKVPQKQTAGSGFAGTGKGEKARQELTASAARQKVQANPAGSKAVGRFARPAQPRVIDEAAARWPHQRNDSLAPRPRKRRGQTEFGVQAASSDLGKERGVSD